MLKHPSIVTFRAGPGAAAHIRERGLAPADIACIPAAAGGPKGLALIPLDKLLHQEWLREDSHLELIGASVGAWRMAALAQQDAVAALDRVQYAYVHDQNYAEKPTPGDFSAACRRIARSVLGGRALEVRPEGVSLTIVTARARGPLQDSESRLAFGRAVLTNAISRRRLSGYLERVLFTAGMPGSLAQPFDDFDTQSAGLAFVAQDTLAGDRKPGLIRGVLEVAGVEDAHRHAERTAEVLDDPDLRRPGRPTPVDVHVQEGQVVAVDLAEGLEPAGVRGGRGGAGQGLGVAHENPREEAAHHPDVLADLGGDARRLPAAGLRAIVDRGEEQRFVESDQVDATAGLQDAPGDQAAFVGAGEAFDPLAALRGSDIPRREKICHHLRPNYMKILTELCEV